jgi:hypothetical protein
VIPRPLWAAAIGVSKNLEASGLTVSLRVNFSGISSVQIERYTVWQSHRALSRFSFSVPFQHFRG